MTTSNLLPLPDELVLDVLEYLPHADIVQMRLVCRQLRSISISKFGTSFRGLHIRHNKQSARKIFEIARHKELERYVQEITFSADLATGELPNESKCCANVFHASFP